MPLGKFFGSLRKVITGASAGPKLMGTDRFGNRYFEQENSLGTGYRSKRTVQLKDEPSESIQANMAYINSGVPGK